MAQRGTEDSVRSLSHFLSWVVLAPVGRPGGTAPHSCHMERAKGFEPSTSSLGSWHSTAELRPHQSSVLLWKGSPDCQRDSTGSRRRRPTRRPDGPGRQPGRWGAASFSGTCRRRETRPGGWHDRSCPAVRGARRGKARRATLFNLSTMAAKASLPVPENLATPGR